MLKLAVFALLVASAMALPRIQRKVPGGGRIVGGEPVTEGQLPYQIQLRWQGRFICGGSIIGANLVLTAAHCVVGDPASDITVIGGKHQREVQGANEQLKNVMSIVVHQQYDDFNLFNDIALLHLESDFDLSGMYVKAVALPPPMFQAYPGNIIVSGWGALTQGGSLADILQFVALPTVSDETCQSNYPQETVLESMLCAGLDAGGKDSCQGDSGGPLVTDATPPVLVGVVSWGYGCAQAGYPGVNTEVSYFINWIEANK
jgi:trypsin